jgi:hypothetical protein
MRVFALYADACRRNLCNRVAHGLLKPGDISPQLWRLLLHTPFLFGIWEQLACQTATWTPGRRPHMTPRSDEVARG